MLPICGVIDQFTPVLPRLLTVAVNGCCPPNATLALAGVTVTLPPEAAIVIDPTAYE